ncbi:MAG: hypothetical protein KGQ66_10265 [Acidobacteriota bacterium]|nr:hypothetical protein [Acidobacteriota bacterium]
MTQPAQVPHADTDRIRPSSLLPAPGRWVLDRPAEQTDLEPPTGPRFGSTGPDLGYGLKLARRMEKRLELAPGEHLEDVVAGGFACGSRRAAHFGRAPVIYDMEWAFGLWGYLGGAPAELIEWRGPLFRGAAEHYWDQREIVDAVKVDALKLTPAQAREATGRWKDYLIV